MDTQRQRARPIPDAKWELQRATIRDLIFEQKKELKGDDGIMRIMAAKYDFRPTKAQYILRFQKWNFNKYLKAADWLALSRVLERRREEGKKTEVLRNGILVPPDQVCRRIRCSRGQAPSSQVQCLPSNITIRTPPQSPVAHVSQTESTESRPSPPQLQISSPHVPASPLSIFAPTLQGHQELGSQEAQVQSPSSAGQLDDFITSWDSTIGINFPSGVFEDDMLLSSTNGQVSMVPSEYQPSNYDILDLDGLNFSYPSLPALTPFLSSMVVQETSGLLDFSTSMNSMFTRMLPAVRRFVGRFSHLEQSISDVLAAKLPQSSTSLLHCKQSFDLCILQFIFYRLINNGDNVCESDRRNPDMNKLVHELYTAVVHYLFSLKPGLLGELLGSIPFPYGTALTQSLFCAAIERGADNAIREILQQGFDPDRPLRFTVHGILEYPLKKSCMKLHLEATKILLNSSAGSNKTVMENALLSLIKSSRRSDFWRESLEIIELLLSRGATLEPDSLASILDNCPSPVLLLLVHYFQNSMYEMFIENYGLVNIMQRNGYDPNVYEAVGRILKHEYRNQIKSTKVWKECLSAALSNFVLREAGVGVNLLETAGAVIDSNCLFHAVSKSDMKMIYQCLELGLDPNSPYKKGPCSSKGLYWDYREGTALSESVLRKYNEAFQVFKDRGFVAKAGDTSESFRFTLIAACRSGSDSLVEDLLLRRKYLFKRYEKQAIIAAIENCEDNTVLQLLAAGFVPDLDALSAAITARKSTLAELLMGTIAYDSFLYPHEWHNILLKAIWWGNLEIIRKMIRSNVSINCYGNIHSQEWKLPETVFGNAVTSWKATPLSAAILKGNYDVINLLLESGAQLNTHDPYDAQEERSQSITALTACVVIHNVKLLEELLVRGADPLDNNALYMAAFLGKVDALEILLRAFQKRYPWGQKGFGSQTLLWAIRGKKKGTARLLAEVTDANLLIQIRDDGGKVRYITPLCEAILRDCNLDADPDLLPTLMRHSGNPNSVVCIKHHTALTALLYAIDLGSLATVKKLISLGADVFLQPLWQIRRTPLQAAVEMEHEEIVDYLLSKHVDLTGAVPPLASEAMSPRNGATSLQLAAMKGSTSITTKLLDRGADINAKPALFGGRTAFEGATEHGKIEMMQFLFQNGADLLANNQRQFQRAICFARKNAKYPAIEVAEKLLESVGGKKDLYPYDDEADEIVETPFDKFF